MIKRSRVLPFFGASRTEEVDFEAAYRQELPRIYNFFRYRVDEG